MTETHATPKHKTGGATPRAAPAKRTPSARRGRTSPAVTPETYAEFVRQVDLRTIWLQAARVENYHGPETPKQGAFHIDASATWERRSGGFRVLHRSTIRLTGADGDDADEPLADVEVTFGLDFDSTQPMTDALFKIFEEVNLPVNTWPYLREYLATTMGRMSWAPFTLPAVKRGTE